MGGMEVAERFEDLVTWQVLRQLEIEVHRLAEREGIKRDFKFRDQIVDAAGSAVRNVAEGFGRYNPTENARFLDVTRASTLEGRNAERFRHRKAQSRDPNDPNTTNDPND